MANSAGDGQIVDTQAGDTGVILERSALSMLLFPPSFRQSLGLCFCISVAGALALVSMNLYTPTVGQTTDLINYQRSDMSC